jgi:uncharacterized membrane protein SpoIIM required for sporulation
MIARVDTRDDETARFEALVARAERTRPSALSFDDLAALARLYRVHLARLARLRDAGDDRPAVRHVNALCVRAHALLHVEPAARGRLRRALLRDLPHAVGRTWRAQVAAWALLGSGIVVGVALGLDDGAAVHALLPDALGHGPDHVDVLLASGEARADFFARGETPAGRNALFGSFLFAHNTRVGLLAFASGVLAGIPAALLALYNGLTLGAFTSIFLRDPHPWLYVAWILPHGVPELTAIALCTAGGLLLGAAVALPGRRGRVASLRDAVGPAFLLFTASVPLFLVAALVESFVRESALATRTRLLVAVANTGMLVAALAWVRRCAATVAPEAAWLGSLTRREAEAASSGRARRA